MTSTIPEQIQKRLQKALTVVFGADLPSDFSASVDPAQNPQFGDYQSNAAMILAKQLKRSPRELASEIAEEFQGEDLCGEPEIAGPGFINFRIQTDFLASRLGELISDADRLGVQNAAEPKTIVIDFSSPNVAKPMHVGHIRSTIIGDSLARIARFLGHDVITDNHIGDWGTQFGMILYGWKSELDEGSLKTEPAAELLRIYRKVNARCKEEPEVREACKRELVTLQKGDEENLEIWKQCVEFSLAWLKTIYEKLDVQFDHWLGESHYNDQLPDLVRRLQKQGIAQESDGAICIFFPDHEKLADRPPAIIQKADGGFLYATTDLATLEHRIKEWKANAIWYVIGAEQQFHMDQLFAASEMLGFDLDLQFVSFGKILGPDRKMLRTREGDIVQLNDVLDEAVNRASKIVAEKNPDFSTSERDEIAAAIGIGAVKYAELSQYRMTDYVFDWDTMLSLKGNTAPYLLNAYVRSRAIFRKLGNQFDGADELRIEEPAERTLALKLIQYAEVVPSVLQDFRPNALANYLYELATTYHKFWEACPVLKSEGITRETRLALCELTGRILRHGLGLLGIRTVEKM